MTRNQATQLQEHWLEACLSIGIPAITTDTSARIMAIVGVHGGGEEEMVLNRKFTNDVRYIQQRFHIQGGEVPDQDFARLMRHYVKELEDYMAAHSRYEDGKEPKTHIPEWAHNLMRDRYGMKLHG